MLLGSLVSAMGFVCRRVFTYCEQPRPHPAVTFIRGVRKIQRRVTVPCAKVSKIILWEGLINFSYAWRSKCWFHSSVYELVLRWCYSRMCWGPEPGSWAVGSHSRGCSAHRSHRQPGRWRRSAVAGCLPMEKKQINKKLYSCIIYYGAQWKLLKYIKY